MSECAGDKVNEVFIGSCMTNIGHYRAAAQILEGAGTVKGRLWICPPQMVKFIRQKLSHLISKATS